MRRAGVVAGAWAVGTLVVGAAGWWAHGRMSEPDRCRAVVVQVVDAPSITWDDGITATAPHWINALTDGVEHVAPDVQPVLARAVAADDEGYADLLEALPSAARPVADRLRERLLDPRPAAGRRADPDVQEDIVRFRRLAAEGCTFAP